MKITLCASIAFYGLMESVRDTLEQHGHEVKLPPTEVPNEEGTMIPVAEYYAIRKQAGDNAAWVWERKAEAIRWHMDKINWADAILVINPEKNGIPGYIGGNTLIEMGVAFYLRKKIYLWNPVPEMSCREEILGMQPTLINQDLSQITYEEARAPGA